MTCKRSKQCDNADICRFAQSDDYHLLGGSCFTPKDTQTNEEWLHTLTTEQLAEWMAKEKLCNCYFIFPSMEEAIQDAMEWLKQQHHEKE